MIFKFRILLAAVLLSISQLQSGQDKGIKTLCDINGCRFMEIMSDVEVIFDRELHIIDIKNMSGNREDSSMRDIDSLFKTAIIRTENCWHFVSPPVDKQEYFLVLIPYRIY